MEQIGEVKLYHVAQAIKKGTKCVFLKSLVSSILLFSISTHYFSIQPIIYHHTHDSSSFIVLISLNVFVDDHQVWMFLCSILM